MKKYLILILLLASFSTGFLLASENKGTEGGYFIGSSSDEFLQKETSISANSTVPVNASAVASQNMKERNNEMKIPILHITDLYNPPQDPDDHIDLATVIALKEYDLKGVVLDVTQKFIEGAPAGFDIPRDPGFVAVAQLGYLTGRSIPVAMGPTHPLRSADDAALDRSLREQAGIKLVLNVLQNSSQPVVISVVGSARVLTAAYNRNPEVVRAKTRMVLLNAGSTTVTHREWNVNLDTAAYIGLWRSGLPIRWYPCATERGAFASANERGTYFKASHEILFKGLPQPLRAWFSYSFNGNGRGDFIRALSELGEGSVWQNLLSAQRNMWATASLVMATGRVLGRTAEGWRFISASSPDIIEIWPWRLDPIKASVNDQGDVHWQIDNRDSQAQIFGRRGGVEFGAAMGEALNALLISIPVQ